MIFGGDENKKMIATKMILSSHSVFIWKHMSNNYLYAGKPLEPVYSRKVMNKPQDWVISRVSLTFPKVFHDILIQKCKRNTMEVIIDGFPNYTINRNGVVKNIVTGKVKKPSKGANGYLYVDLYNQGASKKFYIHRLLGEHFIPNPHNKRTINHKDGNKLNNSLDNLEWATDAENLKHALITGLRKPKSKKLSDELLRKAFDEFMSSTKSISESAKKYKCSLTQLSIHFKEIAENSGVYNEYQNHLAYQKRLRAKNRKPRDPQRLSKAL